MSLTVKDLIDLTMKQAGEKGFGTKPNEIITPEKIALIHSEISEAYEAYRKKNMNEFAEELGDAVQRILHLAGIFDIDIEKEILKKIDLNKTRSWNWTKMNEKHV